MGNVMRTEELKHEISKLDIAEKLLLIEDVWDEIAQSNAQLSLPQWQKEQLDKRLDLFQAGKVKTTDWQEAHQKLREKYQ